VNQSAASSATMSTVTDSCWDSHQGTNEMTANAMAANGV